ADYQQRSPCQLEKNAHDFLFHSVMLLLSTASIPSRLITNSAAHASWKKTLMTFFFIPLCSF
ncbi:hypothetical protein V5H41_29835, partial [Salmonella enterica]